MIMHLSVRMIFCLATRYALALVYFDRHGFFIPLLALYSVWMKPTLSAELYFYKL